LVKLNTGEIKLVLLKQQNLKELLTKHTLMSYADNNNVALGFIVSNLYEVHKHLKAQGVTIISDEPWNFPDGEFSSICCLDPDGNLLEIQQFLF
jgi:catechol 2,3-dioxygenase-like lactoylglutathione lyase family enzyme